MKIWFFTLSEPTKIENKESKLRRHGQLMNYLNSKGHEITWWCENFDHFTKKIRTKSTKKIKIKKKFDIYSVKSIPYTRNISFKRYLNNFLIGNEMNKLFYKEKAPNVIVISMPPIDGAVPLMKFAKKNKIKVILDIRDMWPDIIKWYFKFLYFLPILPFYLLMKHNLKYLISNSDKVIATSKGMLNWAKNKGNVKKGKYIYISHHIAKTKLKRKINNRRIFLAHVGVIGTSNNSKEFLEYFLKLPKNIQKKFDITFAGYGDLYNELRKKIKVKNIHFVGWQTEKQIKKIYKKANFGLVLYKNRKDFRNNIVNKVSEYLGYGLPIITTLSGESENMLKRRKTYLKLNLETYESFEDTFLNIFRIKNYNQMSENCRKIFEDNFDSNIVLEKFSNEIINEKY